MVTLLILDGFGINRSKYGNAIKMQGIPNIKKLMKEYPNTTLSASGIDVGLSAGQMGNSEVGHLNLGAGRVVYQDLTRIDNAIKDKSFFNVAEFVQAMEKAKINSKALHIMGLCSNGGVHSHINHLKALIKMAYDNQVDKVFLHLFLDGRDTKRDSGLSFVQEISEYIKNYKNTKIASICGRVYAMDREKRYDRIEKAYNMLVNGKKSNLDFSTAITNFYSQNIFDEFIEPTTLKDYQSICNGDSVIFFNYRTDRAREISEAFTNEDFNMFNRKKLKSLTFVCMTEYDEKLKNVLIAFKPTKIQDNLSCVLSKFNKKQYHISETTKYAHVTFFFNGGIEKPYQNEHRELVESHNVLSFASVPEMKAYQITEKAISAIISKNFDFVLINLSNADMLGHTGDLPATIKAIEVLDVCTEKIVGACKKVDCDCIITADHGNAEVMLDDAGKVVTSHTTNKVPVILCSSKFKNIKLKSGGKLANIAPTVLRLLNLPIPEQMESALF